MNKKAVVVSCLLVSMPIFAKGLIHEHLMKLNHHSLIKNSENSNDFSGLWVGQCDESQEQLTLNIVQNDKNITLTFYSTDDQTGNKTEDSFKFPINQVKSKNASTLNSTEHSISSALWQGPNRLSLSGYSVGMGTSDQSRFSFHTSIGFSLVLKNSKLLITDQFSEDIVCVFDKG